MIDTVHILIQAGSGGDGSTSFVPRNDRKTVPCGGDGGNGGRVIIRVSENAPPLESLKFKQHLIAQQGGNGGNNHKRGKNGLDLVLLVPEGTRLFDRERGLVLREHMKKNEEIVLLEGGRGGKGNTFDHESTDGQKGPEIDLEISIRVLADVYFVGLPNAGKSLLLNKLTRASAPSEPYPFSTQDPKLGMFKVSDYEGLLLCDLPSVFKGSSENRGLGNRFLKHAETACLVMLIVDPSSQFAGSVKEGLKIVREEMAAFSEKLAALPQIVIVNKMDLPEAREQAAKEKLKEKVPVFFLSALTGEGLAELKTFLNDFYRSRPKEEENHAA